jgi:hypothetical protein
MAQDKDQGPSVVKTVMHIRVYKQRREICALSERLLLSQEGLRPIELFCTPSFTCLQKLVTRIYCHQSQGQVVPSGHAVEGMNSLRSLEHWDREFESHSKHECLCAFIVCLCCSVCR